MEALIIRERLDGFNDTSNEYEGYREQEDDYDNDELLSLDDIFGTDRDDDAVKSDPIDDFHAYFDDGTKNVEANENDSADPARINTDDPLSLYLQEIGQVPLLSREEEIELAQSMERARDAQRSLATELHTLEQIADMEEQIHRGRAARRHLIEANTRLVVSVAKRYRGYGLPFLDLIQAGKIGRASCRERV